MRKSYDEVMAEAIELTLLFYAIPWDSKKQERWDQITGMRECTNRVLCDFQRMALDRWAEEQEFRKVG
jgi:hypothetical protein